ncbi:MAG: AMP-binding protein [Oscillospiraceae bacterium]|nr:AMP-binding protein [Oscillospiraceae bacterium]
MKSICEYLEEDREKWSDLPYITVKKNGSFVSRTFGETIDDVQALARALISEGVSGNVMLYSRNSYEWTVADLAVMGYVGVCVPIDSEWTAFDISNTLSVIEVNTILYEREKQSVIDGVREKYPAIRCLCTDSFPELMERGRASGVELTGKRDMSKTAMILFTSGTTNRPKAIPLTQANLLHNWDALFARTPMTTADSSYIFLPLNHVYAGVANFLYTIISGMRIYLCSDRGKMLEEMLEIRPTIVCTVPLILNRIYAAADERVMEMLRGIRFLYCGGSFTDPEIKKFFIDNGVKLLEAYGTTETSSVIALSKPDDDNTECNGVILDGLDVRIIDPDADGVGEIIVGGGSVSAGYISRSDKYSEFDSNGFYHTGDLGYIDGERRLFLKGRKKRMIITANGKNVYVDELEKLITENPAVKSAAVFEEDFHPAARIYTDLSEAEARGYIDRINESLPKFKRIKNLYVKSESLGGRLK